MRRTLAIQSEAQHFYAFRLNVQSQAARHTIYLPALRAAIHKIETRLEASRVGQIAPEIERF